MPKITDGADAAIPAGIEQRDRELPHKPRKRVFHISPGHIGHWSARHPWLALVIWIAFVGGALHESGSTSRQPIMVISASTVLQNGSELRTWPLASHLQTMGMARGEAAGSWRPVSAVPGRQAIL